MHSVHGATKEISSGIKIIVQIVKQTIVVFGLRFYIIS